MGRSPTGIEKKVVAELYVRCRGAWKKIREEYDDLVRKGRPGIRPRSVESLQKIHKRHVRGVREGWERTRISLSDELLMKLDPFLKRIGQLEASERRLKIELGKAVQDTVRYKELYESLRAEHEELKATHDPRKVTLRVVRGRDVFAAHSGREQ